MSSDIVSRSRSPWRRLAIAGASAFLALAAAEIGHRTLRRVRGWPYDGGTMRAAFVEARNRATQAIPMPGDDAAQQVAAAAGWILHPYDGYDQKQINDQIESDLSVQDRSDDRAYSVLVLGGSVAGLFGTRGGKTFLEEIGRDERLAGKQLRMSNLAQAGYKQPQQAIRLVWLLALGYRPAAVIEIDGFNEVALGYANAEEGFHPLHPSRSHWLGQVAGGMADPHSMELAITARQAKANVARLADLGLRFGLWRSSLAGTLVNQRIRASQNTVNEAESAFLEELGELRKSEGAAGPPLHGGKKAALAIAVDGWLRSSESMRAVCEARSIPYLHVLQPTLHDEGSKPLTRDEIDHGSAPLDWIAGSKAGYPLLRARGEKLRAAGMHFVDASRIFAEVKETLYYDACHFNDQGNEIFARFVAKAFLDALPARKE